MCLCDNKYFKITNTTTGRTKLYTRAASIATRFGCSKGWVFRCMRKPYHLSLSGEQYRIEINSHPECEEVRRDIIQRYGIRLGKIPDRHRHLLPAHRQRRRSKEVLSHALQPI